MIAQAARVDGGTILVIVIVLILFALLIRWQVSDRRRTRTDPQPEGVLDHNHVWIIPPGDYMKTSPSLRRICAHPRCSGEKGSDDPDAHGSEAVPTRMTPGSVYQVKIRGEWGDEPKERP